MSHDFRDFCILMLATVLMLVGMHYNVAKNQAQDIALNELMENPTMYLEEVNVEASELPEEFNLENNNLFDKVQMGYSGISEDKVWFDGIMLGMPKEDVHKAIQISNPDCEISIYESEGTDYIVVMNEYYRSIRCCYTVNDTLYGIEVLGYPVLKEKLYDTFDETVNKLELTYGLGMPNLENKNIKSADDVFVYTNKGRKYFMVSGYEYTRQEGYVYVVCDLRDLDVR